MAANVGKIKKDIEARYIERTSKSQKYYTEARKYLPGGETRESTFFKPHPLYMERGRGSALIAMKILSIRRPLTSLRS